MIQRHERKQLFEIAKVSDEIVLEAIKLYEAALSQGVKDQETLASMKAKVDTIEAEAQAIDVEIKKLRSRWQSKRDAYGKAKVAMHEFAVKLTKVNRAKEKLTAALNRSNNAWKRFGSDERRDRKAQKKAKDLLGS